MLIVRFVSLLLLLLMLRSSRPSSSRRSTLLRPARVRALDPAFVLKVLPPLHRDLAAVELAVVLVASLLRLACRLPRITPREIIKLPVRIRWEDEVPDGQ